MGKPGRFPALADLAVVELDQAVPQRPIPISPCEMRLGTVGQVQGWGVTCDADLNDPACRASSRMWQQHEIRRVPDALCNDPLLARGTGLCMRSADGRKKSACLGDSGSGVFTVVGGRPVFVGAVAGDGDPESLEEFRPYECTTAPTVPPGSAVAQDLSKSIPWIAATVWQCDTQQGHELQDRLSEANTLLTTLN